MYDIYHIIKALIIKIINAPNSPEQETKSLFRNKSTLTEKIKNNLHYLLHMLFLFYAMSHYTPLMSF